MLLPPGAERRSETPLFDSDGSRVSGRYGHGGGWRPASRRRKARAAPRSAVMGCGRPTEDFCVTPPAEDFCVTPRRPWRGLSAEGLSVTLRGRETPRTSESRQLRKFGPTHAFDHLLRRCSASFQRFRGVPPLLRRPCWGGSARQGTASNGQMGAEGCALADFQRLACIRNSR